jgi:hypothetical protein
VNSTDPANVLNLLKSELLKTNNDQKVDLIVGKILWIDTNTNNFVLRDKQTAVYVTGKAISTNYLGKYVTIKNGILTFEDGIITIKLHEKSDLTLNLLEKFAPNPLVLNTSLSALAFQENSYWNGQYVTVFGKLSKSTTDQPTYVIKDTYLNELYIYGNQAISDIESFNANKPITISVDATLTGYLFAKNESGKVKWYIVPFGRENIIIDIPPTPATVSVDLGILPPLENATATYLTGESKLSVSWTYPATDVKFIVYREYAEEWNSYYSLLGSTNENHFETVLDNETFENTLSIAILAYRNSKESLLTKIKKEDIPVK